MFGSNMIYKGEKKMERENMVKFVSWVLDIVIIVSMEREGVGVIEIVK